MLRRQAKRVLKDAKDKLENAVNDFGTCWFSQSTKAVCQRYKEPELRSMLIALKADITGPLDSLENTLRNIQNGHEQLNQIPIRG